MFQFQFHSTLGNYMITIFFATIATLAFESPVVVIEKLIFQNHGKNKNETENAAKPTSASNGSRNA